jgi:hypothetical protein
MNLARLPPELTFYACLPAEYLFHGRRRRERESFCVHENPGSGFVVDEVQ